MEGGIDCIKMSVVYALNLSMLKPVGFSADDFLKVSN